MTSQRGRKRRALSRSSKLSNNSLVPPYGDGEQETSALSLVGCGVEEWCNGELPPISWNYIVIWVCDMMCTEGSRVGVGAGLSG